jgi:hypothetical protein
MSQKVTLQKQVFDKNQYKQVIDTSFTQLANTTPTAFTGSTLPTINEFFEYYNQLFFDIPKFGATDSHEYLIKTSQDYVGTSNMVNDEVQELIDEITELRQENLDLNQQILNLAQATTNG